MDSADILDLVRGRDESGVPIARRKLGLGLLFPPKEALVDDEHPWWYMTAR